MFGIKFNIWQKRTLTLLGRILISKTFGISNLVHSISLADIPLDVIKAAQVEINKYIRKNKPAKIRHISLIGPIDEEGLNSIDMLAMVQSLSLAWLQRLLKESA